MNKICLIRNVKPESFGGGETYQVFLASELKKQGIRPVILSSSRRMREMAEKRGIENFVAPFLRRQNWSGWRNVLLPIYVVWQMYLYFWYKKFFKEKEIDAVNIQSRDDWIAATLAARKIGIKIVWTDHTDFRKWVMQNVEIWYKNLIGKVILLVAKVPEKIIMVSDFELEEFKKKIYPRKLENLIVVKNGAIDLYDEYRQAKSQAGSICFLARLENEKGVLEMIKAYESICADFPESRLEIYGEGELRGEIERVKNKQIKFYGFTKKPLEKMMRSEIFVLPSRVEGLSLTLLDAVMLGRAIIATNVDGNPEVVEDGKSGILVPSGDVKRMAVAMRRLLSDGNEVRRLAKGAREKYEKEFVWSEIVERRLLPIFSLGKISVVIPVYNLEKCLCRCLESVMMQSYADLEIIVVNDGSSDGSRELIRKYQEKDERIVVIDQKNQGLSAARNVGIARATGEYVVLVDGDDVVEKDFVMKLAEGASRAGAEIGVCGYRTVYEEDGSFGRGEAGGERGVRTDEGVCVGEVEQGETVCPAARVVSGEQGTIGLLTGQLNLDVVAWNKIYKRSLFETVQYPVGKIHEDNLTTYKLYAEARKIVYVNYCGYRYYKRKGSITDTSGVMERLEMKEVAAREGVARFKDNKRLFAAAKVALVLAQFGFIDNHLKDPELKIDFDERVLNIKKIHAKGLFLTAKLRFYIWAVGTPRGVVYKMFRKVMRP